MDSVAAQCGHLPETIWNAPENRGLKNARKDLHILMPGDRLFVPPPEPKTVSAATGRLHRFTVQRPRARLKVQIVDAGAPLANAPFVLLVDGNTELRGRPTATAGWTSRCRRSRGRRGWRRGRGGAGDRSP